MPPLYGEVRSLLRDLVPPGSSLLDVGGRKSWYTSGLPVTVTISDLPREAEIQHELNLGMTTQIESHIRSKRSNVAEVILDDMSATQIEPDSFDAIVSVEVIEHVDDDFAFVENLARTVRPNGPVILTTPNGDRNPIPTGDHRRHYRKAQLEDLLRQSFDEVRVQYAVAATSARMMGLNSVNPRRPARAIGVMSANVRNRRESGQPTVRVSPAGSAHLIAVARTSAGA